MAELQAMHSLKAAKQGTPLVQGGDQHLPSCSSWQTQHISRYSEALANEEEDLKDRSFEP